MSASTTEVQAKPHPALTLADLRRVERIVAQHLGPAFDRESIASDILLESWLNDQPTPALSFIRHRCIDAMRARAKEHLVMQEAAAVTTFTLSPEAEEALDNQLEVDQLIRSLDNQERKLIALRFWMNLSMEACAQRLGVNPSVARLTLLRALEKMKEAV